MINELRGLHEGECHSHDEYQTGFDFGVDCCYPCSGTCVYPIPMKTMILNWMVEIIGELTLTQIFYKMDVQYGN